MKGVSSKENVLDICGKNNAVIKMNCNNPNFNNRFFVIALPSLSVIYDNNIVTYCNIKCNLIVIIETK